MKDQQDFIRHFANERILISWQTIHLSLEALLSHHNKSLFKKTKKHKTSCIWLFCFSVSDFKQLKQCRFKIRWCTMPHTPHAVVVMCTICLCTQCTQSNYDLLLLQMDEPTASLFSPDKKEKEMKQLKGIQQVCVCALEDSRLKAFLPARTHSPAVSMLSRSNHSRSALSLREWEADDDIITTAEALINRQRAMSSSEPTPDGWIHPMRKNVSVSPTHTHTSQKHPRTQESTIRVPSEGRFPHTHTEADLTGTGSRVYLWSPEFKRCDHACGESLRF